MSSEAGNEAEDARPVTTMVPDTPTAQPTESEEALLTPLEARLLGCLMEKERTTPDQYPLTLNGLVTACNQKTKSPDSTRCSYP